MTEGEIKSLGELTAWFLTRAAEEDYLLLTNAIKTKNFIAGFDACNHAPRPGVNLQGLEAPNASS